MEPPPKALQIECPLCLDLLEEPCLIGCCRYKFCRECVVQVKNADQPCPLCGKQDFPFMRERGLERFLNGLEVWCPHRLKGCEWKMERGKLKEHLNQNPTPENRLNGCQFVEIECVNKCGMQFQRCHIATHQNEQCKKRPYSCEFCRSYASSSEDEIEVHYRQCGKCPVTCPKCRVYPVKRQDLEGHLRDRCPVTLVDCPFNYAGCDIQLPRRDMPKHVKDTGLHLTLLENTTKTLMKENQELQHKLQTTGSETQSLKLDLQQHINPPGWPFDFRVNYTEEEVFSPAFYTHPHGYRMCVHVYPNGVGDGEGTHVSIFTYMMRGPFDDYLKWPFRGEITIQLVNQAGDHDHIEKTIHYNDETPDIILYANRVTGRERAKDGWGKHQFLCHTDLGYDAARNTQYLKNNHLIACVLKVNLST